MTFTYETSTNKDGSVTLSKTVNLGADPVTGKRRQTRISAATVKELRRKYTETTHKLHTGGYIEASRATLGEYLATWLDAITPTIRPASHDRYTRIVKRQIVPALGSVPLAKLTPLHVQDFYAACLAAKLSTTTVALYHGILHRALDQAVKWRMLPRNVCDAVDAPRPRNPEMQTWTAKQARAFLLGTAGEPLAAFWQLALNTGMRRGELLALRWADVDLDAGGVTVARTVTRGAAGVIFGEPKTRAGRRSLSIPAPVVLALKAHRARQAARRLQAGPAWLDLDLVFERGNGDVLHPNIASRTFRETARRLGLPPIRLHDLRHSAATLMLANGVDAKTVQNRLGHSDVAMTLNRYVHATTAQDRAASERLGDLLSG